MDFDWKRTLATVAPALATAFGTPVTGAAVRVLAEGLLGKEEASQQEIGKAVLTASPDQLVKLKTLDKEFQETMKGLGIDLERIHAEDRQSARNMAKGSMVPQVILSSFYTLGYVLVLLAFMSGEVSIAAGAKAEFSMVLGVLTAAQVQILNFWFGSSSGSKAKDNKPVSQAT